MDLLWLVSEEAQDNPTLLGDAYFENVNLLSSSSQVPIELRRIHWTIFGAENRRPHHVRLVSFYIVVPPPTRKGQNKPSHWFKIVPSGAILLVFEASQHFWGCVQKHPQLWVPPVRKTCPSSGPRFESLSEIMCRRHGLHRRHVSNKDVTGKPA